jgi:hypothetical protein
MSVFDDGSGPALYVGGVIAGAGGVGANNIARWNGTSWSGVGGGLNDMVTALSVFDDGSGPALYAGGRFGSAGGMPATLVARWDGTSWSAPGGGMTASPSAEVDCLVAFDDGSGPALHAGGIYVGAVDSGDSNLARWGCAKGGATFCFGDAADCPCGNGGAPGRGCDNAQGTGGVELALVAQTTAPNGTTVTGTGFSTMGAPTALVFRSAGLAATPAPFGDGLGCLAPAGVVRLAATTAIAGTSTHAFGHGAMAGAGDFYYQIWYRNTPSAYCTPAAFNLSNGLRISWP